MKNIRYYLALPTLVGLLFVASCTKESTDNGATGSGKEPISVPFSYSAAGLTATDSQTTGIGTRTMPTGLTNAVQNIWVIQFEGITTTSKVIGAPRYMDNIVINDTDKEGVVSLLTTGEAYQVWVANMTNGAGYDWGLSATSTFADVATKILTLDSEAKSWASIDGPNYHMMSAVTKSAVNANTILEPKFVHTAAKVSLKVNNLKAGLTILSARLCNVPTKMYVADEALKGQSLVNGTDKIWPYDSPYFNYLDSESNTLAVTSAINTARTGTYTWLMPRNNQGTNPLSTTAQTKTYYAPMNATYFEVKVKDEAGKSGIFKIYPGANQTNDYNITPNTEYTSTIDIEGVGDPETTDSRVTQTYEDRDFRGTNSNCYILNPNPVAVRTFKVPVTQVNRYWSAAGDGYGTKDNAIGASDNWTVSLLWSDIENNGYLSKATGTGPNDYFEIALPANNKTGNFTIKLTKDGSPKILWSWHFWVTDYNPDGFSNSSIDNTKDNGAYTPKGIFTYAVSGGQVERYTGGVWAAGGVYEKKVIMDRAIGAVETYFTTQHNYGSRGLLTYQFGRKDPFPTTNSLGSSIWGTAITNRTDVAAADQVSISAAVVNPTLFYNRHPNGGNWTFEVDRVDYIWNDPVGTRTGSKSVYDPCPAGWRVAVDGTWDSFNSTTALNPLRDLGWGSGRGIGTGGSQIDGIRYWPGTSNAAPATGRIWYPASGNRTNDTGVPTNIRAFGFTWSCSPYSTSHSRYLYFSSSVVTPSGTRTRTTGVPVRCVQE